MKDRSKTIESLRRVAERPGSPNEGEIARRLLEQLGVKPWTARPFDPLDFPKGTRVFYCYWAYENTPGTIVSDNVKTQRSANSGTGPWMRIKFDYLKQPRWVPVISPLGCHLSLNPFPEPEAGILYHMNLNWEQRMNDLIEEIRKFYGYETTDPEYIRMVRKVRKEDNDTDTENQIQISA